MPLDATDLDEILANSGTIWEELRNRRVFLTGGSGFFGSWLLEGFCHANRQLGLNARVIVLTRDARRFASKLPHLTEQDGVEIEEGDFRNFRSPSGPVDYVIHSLVPDVEATYKSSSQNLYEFFADSVTRLLDLVQEKRSHGMLLCSTGAVYAHQALGRPFTEQDSMAQGGHDMSSLYGPIRRSAELIALLRFVDRQLPVKIARGFTFTGPYLQLNTLYAIGNFISDVLNRRAVLIKGDGTDVRSYMYGTDLSVWLWTVLLRGKAGQAYNVGSSQSLTLREIADRASALTSPRLEVIVKGKHDPLLPFKSFYVPDVSKAKHDLNLRENVSFDEALERTYRFFKRAAG